MNTLERVEQLTYALLEHDLSDEQQLELEQLLNHDAAAQARHLAVLQLEAALVGQRNDFDLSAATMQRLEPVTTGKIEREVMQRVLKHAAGAQAQVLPLQSARRNSPRWFQRPMVWGLATAATIACGIIIGLVIEKQSSLPYGAPAEHSTVAQLDEKAAAVKGTAASKPAGMPLPASPTAPLPKIKELDTAPGKLVKSPTSPQPMKSMNASRGKGRAKGKPQKKNPSDTALAGALASVDGEKAAPGRQERKKEKLALAKAPSAPPAPMAATAPLRPAPKTIASESAMGAGYVKKASRRAKSKMAQAPAAQSSGCTAAHVATYLRYYRTKASAAVRSCRPAALKRGELQGLSKVQVKVRIIENQRLHIVLLPDAVNSGGFAACLKTALVRSAPPRLCRQATIVLKPIVVKVQ